MAHGGVQRVQRPAGCGHALGSVHPQEERQGFGVVADLVQRHRRVGCLRELIGGDPVVGCLRGCSLSADPSQQLGGLRTETFRSLGLDVVGVVLGVVELMPVRVHPSDAEGGLEPRLVVDGAVVDLAEVAHRHRVVAALECVVASSEHRGGLGLRDTICSGVGGGVHAPDRFEHPPRVVLHDGGALCRGGLEVARGGVPRAGPAAGEAQEVGGLAGVLAGHDAGLVDRMQQLVEVVPPLELGEVGCAVEDLADFVGRHGMVASGGRGDSPACVGQSIVLVHPLLAFARVVARNSAGDCGPMAWRGGEDDLEMARASRRPLRTPLPGALCESRRPLRRAWADRLGCDPVPGRT